MSKQVSFDVLLERTARSKTRFINELHKILTKVDINNTQDGETAHAIINAIQTINNEYISVVRACRNHRSAGIK